MRGTPKTKQGPPFSGKPTKSRSRSVSHDPAHPRAGMIHSPYLAPATEGSHEGVLAQVLSDGHIAAQGICHSEDPAVLALIEGAEVRDGAHHGRVTELLSQCPHTDLIARGQVQWGHDSE